jgi:hypothetical protein
LALLIACLIGTSWLAGAQIFFDLPGPLAFMLCLFVSMMAYILTIAVEYVVAKYREAVPLKIVAQGVTIELLVQSWGTVGVSMVLGGLFSGPARPLLGIVGSVVCIATTVFAFTNGRRVKGWRAAWNGDDGAPRPPQDDMPRD